MGRKCYVPDCLSEEGREEDRGVTFHKIPLHSDIRPKWLSLCHVPSDKHSCKVIHVCSRHFLKVDFCNFKGKKYMLRQGVLPSVFPWSKLKKDPEFITIVKKEPDVTTTKPMQVESEICLDTVMKVEIKEEPGEFVLNTDIKQESFDDDFAQCETSHPPVVAEKSSTTIEQKGKSIETPDGLLNFSVNTQLEALDFNQMWFPAHIVEVDYEESEVLIHFEKYSSKYDEWISMNSSRLRPFQPQNVQPPHQAQLPQQQLLTQPSEQSETMHLPKKVSNKQVFFEGENVMASWSDARKFPAVIKKVLDHDTYEVRFVDGFMKILKGHRIMKTHGKIGCAPLFDPASGTKQDRRNKKRKLNVAQLFRKRLRADTSEGLSPSINMDVGSGNSGEETEGWMPKWENGRPRGVESVIETHDGLKKSIILPDPRLPPNWAKHVVQRTTGASAGKWDTVIVSPEGRRFRIRSEIKAYLEENPQLNYNEDMFTFSLYRRSRTRRVTHSVDVPQHTIVLPQKKRQAPQDDTSNLKILLVDDAYKCPIAGCEKSFRRENLAQMHVKHYHPKFTKFLDSTPNVADLAYARTVGESLDKSPERLGKLTPGRPGRPLEKVVTPKVATPKPSISNEPEISQECLDAQASLLQKTRDSEILKLLNSKPPEESSTKFPPGLPSGMYPPIKLKDLLNKSEGIPKGEDLNLKSLSASTSRPTGIKTLLPVVRTNDAKRSEEKVLEEPLLKNSIKPILKQNLKRKRFISDNADVPTPKMIETEMETPTPAVSEQLALPENNQNYIVEGGEVIKIVRMKREEIINCTCGITEEDGLMIQCELCLCWQHAYCNNIERENQVPEKYICYICQNPMRSRSSRKYFHDQDWLKNGTLPVGSYHCKDVDAHKKRFELLKKSHDLSGLLVELSDYMNSVKVKLKIAQTKNHQKLYLWSKPWEKLPLPEKMELGQEGEIPFSRSELDLFSNKIESHNDSSFLSLLKSPKSEQKMKEELSKLDLNTLIENNFEQLPPPIIPQPEAAINSIDCKLNLLDHIAHSQNLIEERLEAVQAQVDALDGGDNNNEEDFSLVSKTVQMLLKDLGTLQELSHSSSL